MTAPLLLPGSPAARAAYEVARLRRIVQIAPEPDAERLADVALVLAFLLEHSRDLPRITVAVPDREAAAELGEELIRGFAAAGRQATWEPHLEAIKVVPERWFKDVWIDLAVLTEESHLFLDNGVLIFDTARSGVFPDIEDASVSQLLLVHSGTGPEGPVTLTMQAAVAAGWPRGWVGEVPPELILAGAP